MQWYDIGAYILMAICAVALIALAGAVLLIVVMTIGGFLSMWKSEKEPIRTAETPVGTFTAMGNRWIATEVMGRDLTVWALDRDGAPDPDFLAGLPDLLAALPEYERRAREYEVLLDHDPYADDDEEVDEEFEYKLVGISQADGVLNPGAEFELDFEHPTYDSAGYEIVFAGGQPIDSNAYDNH
ncbi:MAG: hypothetical protein ACO1SV_10310 [Fimbriimonas sp.]